MTSLAATGKIRNYQVAVSLLVMMTIPVSYFMFRSGMAPEMVYYVMICFSALSGAVRFLFARHQIGFSLRNYVRKVLMRTAAVLALSLPVPLALRLLVFHEDNVWTFLALCAVSVVCVAASVWFAGLDRSERDSTGKMIADWLHKVRLKR